MKANYKTAREVRQVALDVIEKFHTHLQGERIQYVFADEVPKSKGRELWGKVQKITGLAGFFSLPLEERGSWNGSEFWVVVIPHAIWTRLDQPQREALIDDQLSRIVRHPETGELVAADPDITTFSATVARHGFWNQNLQTFLKTVQSSGQMDLSLGNGLSVVDGGSVVGNYRLVEHTNSIGRNGYQAVHTETGEVFTEDGREMFFATASIGEQYLRNLQAVSEFSEALDGYIAAREREIERFSDPAAEQFAELDAAA